MRQQKFNINGREIRLSSTQKYNKRKTSQNNTKPIDSTNINCSYHFPNVNFL